MESAKIEIRFSQISKQAKGNGRIPKNPDVPRKGTNPKENQDPLPPKNEKKKKK